MSKGYFTIQSWMVTKLGLKTVERDMFAIVYGYSQDGESSYYSSIQWASDVTGYSKNSVCSALKKLVQKNLIIKEPIENSQRIRYRANLELVNITIQGTCTPENITIQATCIDTPKTIQGTCIGNKDNIKNKKYTNNKLLVDLLADNLANPKISNDTSKPKKQSLWQKCMNMIDDYTREYENSKELNDALIAYLRMRLEMKDKPMYANQWKGMLNKLSKLSDDVNEQCEIVQQSINRGYLGFFEVKKYNNRSITQREGMSSKRDTHTQEERQKIRKGASDGKYERI